MDRKDFIDLFSGRPDIRARGIWDAQQIANKCMSSLQEYLRSGLTRQEIHSFCADLMTREGSEGWWIHGDPALILFGPHTTFSAHDDPSPLFEGLLTGENDYITVDVAPTVNGGWGDITRGFVLENGMVIPWKQSSDPEITEGMLLEEELHRAFIDFVSPDTTFSQLHRFTQKMLDEHGYRNCDYHGNFGHTIENDRADRVTIIPEEHRSIAGYGRPITYEPHICRIGGTKGIKHENMYVFRNGRMEEV